ncbi:MAG TPA: immunoglobulin domain-containing protein [Alphaproteobacteria bacterium]|nr:immunoglobulin domain-containing protein [Alphaproteobacteria bacterium]
MTHKQHGIGANLALSLVILLMAIARTEAQALPYPFAPLFQYQVFYNMDLDMSPGNAMTFTGPVFCNSNIWCYPAAELTFDNTVEAGGNYFFHWDTNGDQSANITDDPISPVFNYGQPTSHVQAIFPSSVFGPYPTVNFESLINLPPDAQRAPQEIAYYTTNQIYLFNEVDLIVSNASYGINGLAPWTNPFIVYLQDRSVFPSLPRWTQLTNDVYIISNCYPSHALWATPVNWVPHFQFTNNMRTIMWTNTTAGSSGPGPVGTNCVWYAGFSFLTNVAYYDYRESRTSETVQLDVGKLGAWITNNAPNGGSNWNNTVAADLEQGINSIFIYNDAPFTSTLLPSVSVINGALLPSSAAVVQGISYSTSGLTVVTPQPLYVIGNYNVETNGGSPVLGSHNVVATYPAALMADAITVLSANWPNDWIQNSYSSRPAASTTINAACLTGIVPSTGGQADGGDGSQAHYSGGLENYFRLLENWSASGGDTLTYNGSMAAMFSSIYATNYWQLPDNYYGIPIRNWAFDTNFFTLAGLPPLTPLLINSNAAPLLLAQPTNAIVLLGQTTNFTVSASGAPAVSYQWFYAGRTNIFGATNASLSLTDIQLAEAGNYYVIVTNVFGSITSSNALLSVYASASPVLNGFSLSQTGGVGFSVFGVPGFNYTVQASTNLIDWVPLMTGNSPFIFTDTNATLSQRFYRGVYLP